MKDLLTRLRESNADLEHDDAPLQEELREVRDAAGLITESLSAEDKVNAVVEIDGESVDRFEFEQETIVLRTGRRSWP